MPGSSARDRAIRGGKEQQRHVRCYGCPLQPHSSCSCVLAAVRHSDSLPGSSGEVLVHPVKSASTSAQCTPYRTPCWSTLRHLGIISMGCALEII